MPYKDPAKRRECNARSAARWAAKNPDKAKAARKRWQAQRTRQARRMVQEAKNQPCEDCGIQYPHYIMDLDHRDPEDKVMSVASMVGQQTSLERLAAEIAKCDVVCSNCHRERTYLSYEKRWYDDV